MAHHFHPLPPPQVVDVIDGAFALAAVRDEAAFAQTALARASVCYSVDRELVSFCKKKKRRRRASEQGPKTGEGRGGPGGLAIGLARGQGPAPSHTATPDSPQLYEPFYEDFGPLNLGKTHKFVMRTHQLLQVRE